MTVVADNLSKVINRRCGPSTYIHHSAVPSPEKRMVVESASVRDTNCLTKVIDAIGVAVLSAGQIAQKLHAARARPQKPIRRPSIPRAQLKCRANYLPKEVNRLSIATRKARRCSQIQHAVGVRPTECMVLLEVVPGP